MITERIYMSSRLENCLKSEGYKTLDDIIQQREVDVRKIPNLGKGSMDELKAILLARGLYFRGGKRNE